MLKISLCTRLFMVLLFSICASVPSLEAQSTIPGHIENDNPDKLVPLSFLIHPMYYSSWKPNSSAGMEMGFMIHAGKFLDIDLNGLMAYKERNKSKADNPRLFAPFNSENLTFGLNFGNIYSDRVYKVKYHGDLVLTDVNLKRRMSFAFRIGANHQGSTVWTNDVDAYFVSDLTSDTANLTDRNYYSAFNYTLGLSFKNMFNAVIVADGARLKRGKWSEFYVDAIVNMKTRFQEQYQNSDTGTVHLNSRKMGYRLGCKFIDPSHTNFCFGFEIGSTAGPLFLNKQSYFLFKMGFAITESGK